MKKAEFIKAVLSLDEKKRSELIRLLEGNQQRGKSADGNGGKARKGETKMENQR